MGSNPTHATIQLIVENISDFFSHLPNAKVIAGYSNKSESLDDLLQSLKLQHFSTVQMEQVHDNHWVEIVDGETTKIAGADGMFTSKVGTCLVVRWADCLPILFSHSSGMIGAVHAGRKGTQKEILKETMTAIQNTGVVSESVPLQLWFGPRICEECYQIDEKADTYFDLVRENQNQLLSVFNAKQVAVTVDQHCTKTEVSKFHSYRREGTGTPMNYAVIALVENSATNDRYIDVASPNSPLISTPVLF